MCETVRNIFEKLCGKKYKLFTYTTCMWLVAGIDGILKLYHAFKNEVKKTVAKKSANYSSRGEGFTQILKIGVSCGFFKVIFKSYLRNLVLWQESL